VHQFDHGMPLGASLLQFPAVATALWAVIVA